MRQWSGYPRRREKRVGQMRKETYLKQTMGESGVDNLQDEKKKNLRGRASFGISWIPCEVSMRNHERSGELSSP